MGVVVSMEDGREPGASAMEELQALLAGDLEKVDAFILRGMDSDVPLIPQLAGHLITSRGKRIRPLLTLAAARMCRYEGADHQKLAATVEFIHTATLLHDDVVDESGMRRGKETANILWGNQASVLVGDFLFSRSFRLMVEVGHLRILDILSNASAVIAEGEVMQLAAANNTATTEDAYMNVITAKTAALFAAAAHVGAVVAGSTEEEEAALESYGRNLGVAFQLIDDVLDYSGRQAKLGKSIGDDFREGKITLPVILAFRRGDDDERKFWQRTLGSQEQSGDDFSHALELINKHGALDDTAERARHYGAIARDALAIFPAGEHCQALSNLVGFCTERAY